MRKIHCPHCRHRLFDVNDASDPYIEIKCPKCGKIIKLKLTKTPA